MNRHDELINELSADLTAVKPATNVGVLAWVWLATSTAYVILLTHLWGPIRPNAFQQLAGEPRFFVETLLGVAAIATTALAAFKAAVPGALSHRLASLSAGLLGLWLASYVLGLFSPALEPSMLGKRPHCLWETLVYALPPAIVGFVLVRRLYPLRPIRTATVVAMVSGLIPALYMQLACMYAPAHMLAFHVLPGLSVAIVGTALAWRFLRRD